MSTPTPEERAAILAALPWIKHADCVWEQVGPCVYCTAHGERLFQGKLPEAKGGTPPCETHDWDEEEGLGFYFLCRRCGTKEWAE